MAKFSKALDALKNEGPNLQEVKAGGGDYTPPAEGKGGIRFVGYIEIGTHAGSYQGKPNKRAYAIFQFELHGKKWPYLETDNGPVASKVEFRIAISQSKKAAYYKLFQRMRDGRDNITHFAEMLGEAFVGTVVHDVAPAKDDMPERIFVRLQNDDGYTIFPPFVDVPDEDGEVVRKKLKVADVLNGERLLLWNFADKEQWDSIFIDGEYEDGGSRNKWQLKVQEALDFEDSSIAALAAKGKITLPELKARPARGKGKTEKPETDEGALNSVSDDESAPSKPKGDAKPKADKAEKKETKAKKDTPPPADDADEDTAPKTTRRRPPPPVTDGDDDLLDGVE